MDTAFFCMACHRKIMSRQCILVQWLISSPLLPVKGSKWHLWGWTRLPDLPETSFTYRKKKKSHKTKQWEPIMESISLSLTLSLCTHPPCLVSLGVTIKEKKIKPHRVHFFVSEIHGTELSAKSSLWEPRTADQRCSGIINKKWK